MKIEKQSIYYEKNTLTKELIKKKYEKMGKRQRSIIYGIVTVLSILSMANMISTTFYRVVTSGKDVLLSLGDPLKHLIWLLGGMIILIVVSRIPYDFYKKARIRAMLLGFSITVLLGVLIGSKIVPGIVPNINGAIGWIRIGPITLQPAEFLKVSYVILLAYILDTTRKNKLTDKQIIISVTPIVGIFSTLIMAQGDLGTTLHYLAITAFLLLVSPISKKLIGVVLAGLSAIFSLFLTFFYFVDLGGGYRLRRITSYINILLRGDERDMGIGYQVIQSLIAMGNGGLFGKGYGNGVQKYNYLPEIHTDFISASLAEEWGFIVMAVVILTFLLILWIGLNTATITRSYFGKYLSIGLVTLIFTQMIMNLYVATGLMPVTGLPLPLFSYGGSSTLTVFISLGILLNINRKTIEDEYGSDS